MDYDKISVDQSPLSVSEFIYSYINSFVD